MPAGTTIGLDIAKSVFQVHGIDAEGQLIIRRQLRRPRSEGSGRVPSCQAREMTRNGTKMNVRSDDRNPAPRPMNDIGMKRRDLLRSGCSHDIWRLAAGEVGW